MSANDDDDNDDDDDISACDSLTVAVVVQAL